MKHMKKLFFVLPILAVCLLVSCDDGKVNFFTVDQDMQFGEEVLAEILADPVAYPVLSKTAYPEVYTHIESIRNSILSSGHLKYAERFDWEVYVIHNDTVLNAFAVPGGKTFYYTGLIKFLDDEASLAGVMAHEMAHADKRHSTSVMTKQYGYSVLLSVLSGGNESTTIDVLESLAMGLGSLKFSRDHEYEADEAAVTYLYDTEYDARGVAYFFEKMDPKEQSAVEVYLSTHPSPVDRIEKIHKRHEVLGGKDGGKFPTQYLELKNLLP
jgi:predicted Zn-dependent protease